MIYAQKGNQVTKIEENQIASLLEQGFNIIDEKGSVLHRAVPTDLLSLKRAYVDNMRRIKELEEEVKSLKAAAQKKATAKAEVKAEPKTEAVAEPKEEPKAEEKPKKAAGRKPSTKK